MICKVNLTIFPTLQTGSFQIKVVRNYEWIFVRDWRRKTEKNGKKSFQSLPVFLPPFAAILIVKFAVATIWKVLSRAFQPYQMLYVKYVGKVPHNRSTFFSCSGKYAKKVKYTMSAGYAGYAERVRRMKSVTIDLKRALNFGSEHILYELSRTSLKQGENLLKQRERTKPCV